MWKREKEVNTLKYTNNISFPEVRKIIQSKNQFPARSYAQASTSNTDPKQHHSCQSCHSLLETLSKLTPDTLPKFINDLKLSLSEDKQSKPTVILTTQPTVKPQSSEPLREVAKQVAPPQTTQSPHHLLGRAQGLLTGDLDKVPLLVRGSSWRKPTHTKKRFSALEDEESMECGAPPSTPSSPTPEHHGKSPSQTPKPQRKKVNK